MRLAVFGLSITSSWGNGHATLWRGLVRALVRRGCRVSFFERNERLITLATGTSPKSLAPRSSCMTSGRTYEHGLTLRFAKRTPLS